MCERTSNCQPGESFQMDERMKYTKVEELLINDSFLKRYHQTDEREAEAWDEWIGESPEHQRLVNEAVQILDLIPPLQENKITDREIRMEIHRLINAIQNSKKTESRQRKTNTSLS